MSISKNFHSVLSTLGFDDHIRRTPIDVWDDIIAEAAAFAVAEEQEASWHGGSDNSITFYFIDGSKLIVNNPRQNSFGGSWYAR